MTVRKSEFEKLLGRVVSQGVARADSGLLREVAEKLWYGRSVPNLSKFPEPERREAGYLVDRLARVNVMAAARKQKVLAALTPYKPAAPDSQVRHRDALAVTWGAREDLTSRMAELLPYQTRTYEAERKAQAKKRRESLAQALSSGEKPHLSR
ncbi:hypothetical protein ACLIIZ_19455 [Azonexus caeni]|uniref:hypothetical protein n=1 Tax=Azonexus caeni TaxID=266126 RepID=UPI003A846645